MALRQSCTLESPKVCHKCPGPGRVPDQLGRWSPRPGVRWASGEDVAQEGEQAVPFLTLAAGRVQTHLPTSPPLSPSPLPVSPSTCNLELATHTSPRAPSVYRNNIRCKALPARWHGGRACSSSSHMDSATRLLTCVYELPLQRSPVTVCMLNIQAI